MYQTVYIKDMREDLLAKDKEIERLRQQLALREKQLFQLSQESNYLKGKLNTFRRIPNKDSRVSSPNKK